MKESTVRIFKDSVPYRTVQESTAYRTVLTYRTHAYSFYHESLNPLPLGQEWVKCDLLAKSGPPRSFVRPVENIFQLNQLVFHVQYNFQLLIVQKSGPKCPKKILMVRGPINLPTPASGRDVIYRRPF